MSGKNISIRPMTDDDFQQMMSEHERLNPNLPIKEDVVESFKLYVERGIMPGDFLTAVLENNLMEAMARADSYNRATIFQICQYVYNSLPSNCHGSHEKVNNYLKLLQERGEET